ncbi:ABC transporter ATP-binding protein [Leucobacter insecticola]|uniref:ABC transporter ATP-binding protein n=1 Tax=Leucobacter insecticola TaxID=2714934 RepID=A0A6G8FGG5_9MICO|nr:ABC transporter ATP-binding protein [Leucobacter insecticola]QIM15491.1 ABC transporter ATP-binding protein [Leucobacter insecticola]
MITLLDAAVTVSAEAGEATILHPTSLSLSEPRISVIGGNGSGKSTLARLLNGLIEPSSGRVTVLANDTTPLDTVRDGAAVRRSVGFVFTDPAAQFIMPTAVEDVALSLRRQHRDKFDRHRAAISALERFGIARLAEHSVHSLSGGQKQLLAIAAVLASDPAILVADEPTTLLDLRNSRMIGELLMSLPQQVIVVTHDLDLAARADRTLLVEGGRVVYDGDPATAIAHYRARA